MLKSRLKITSFIALAVGLTSPVIAQETPADNVEEADDQQGIREIVVTAQRREDSIQDISVAITAFDQEALSQAAIQDIRDFTGRTPGLVVDPVAAGPAAAAISIRGISFEDIEKSFDPAVGVYVDGVVIGTNTGQLLDAFDLESVEVLRGPQGTFFGRNTIGGVLSVRRSKPTGELGVKASIGYASFDTTRARLVVNTPIIADILSVKAFLNYDDTGGFLFNETLNRRAGFSESWSGGVTALIEPSDNISALITYQRSELDSEFAVAGTSRDGPGGDLICGIEGVIPSFIPASECNRSVRSGRDLYTINQNIETPITFNTDSITAEINIDFGAVKLTSITGWQRSDESVVSDFDASSADFFATERIQDYEQFTQEVRLSGNITPTVDFVVGAYYFDSSYDLDQLTDFGPGILPPAFTPVQLRVDANQDAETFAFFGDFRWDATEDLTLSGGLRYTNDQKTLFNNFGVVEALVNLSLPNFDGECIAPNGLLPSPPFPAGLPSFGAADNCTGSATFERVTWRAAASYDIDPDKQLYGSVSTGFRSGGFNGRASSPSSLGPFLPETVTSYELGLKADWLSRTLRTNLALFQTDYNDKQEEVVQPSPPGSANPQETIVSNAAAARIRGFEAEVIIAPTRDFTFNASLSILDAEYLDFFRDVDGDLIPDDVSTLELRRAPDVTFSFGFNWIKDIGDGTFNLSPQFRFVDEVTTCIVQENPPILGAVTNDPRCLSDPREILDITASYDFNIGTGDVKLSAFVRNLLDDRGIAGTLPVAGLFTFSNLRPPRQFGAELQFQF